MNQPSPKSIFRNGILLGLLCGVLTGCSGGNAAPPVQTVPAKGTVTLNGKPLPNATVMFIPKGDTKGIECSGMTNQAGEYQIQHPQGADGVPPGKYAVVVSQFVDSKGVPVDLSSGAMPADLGAVELLPDRYSSLSDTQLVAEVSATGGNFDFALKAR
jgi:hypothetical protein